MPNRSPPSVSKVWSYTLKTADSTTRPLNKNQTQADKAAEQKRIDQAKKEYSDQFSKISPKIQRAFTLLDRVFAAIVEVYQKNRDEPDFELVDVADKFLSKEDIKKLYKKMDVDQKPKSEQPEKTTTKSKSHAKNQPQRQASSSTSSNEVEGCEQTEEAVSSGKKRKRPKDGDRAAKRQEKKDLDKMYSDNKFPIKYNGGWLLFLQRYRDRLRKIVAEQGLNLVPMAKHSSGIQVGSLIWNKLLELDKLKELDKSVTDMYKRKAMESKRLFEEATRKLRDGTWVIPRAAIDFGVPSYVDDDFARLEDIDAFCKLPTKKEYYNAVYSEHIEKLRLAEVTQRRKLKKTGVSDEDIEVAIEEWRKDRNEEWEKHRKEARESRVNTTGVTNDDEEDDEEEEDDDEDDEVEEEHAPVSKKPKISETPAAPRSKNSHVQDQQTLGKVQTTQSKSSKAFTTGNVKSQVTVDRSGAKPSMKNQPSGVALSPEKTSGAPKKQTLAKASAKKVVESESEGEDDDDDDDDDDEEEEEDDDSDEQEEDSDEESGNDQSRTTVVQNKKSTPPAKVASAPAATVKRGVKNIESDEDGESDSDEEEE